MSEPALPEAEQLKLTACIELLRRTGAREVQIRYQDDEQPVVWMVVARWQVENGRPVASGGEPSWECAASINPILAAFRLCEATLGGGRCQKCHRPTGVTLDDVLMPLDSVVCWWQYDSERGQFGRGCDEQTNGR